MTFFNIKDPLAGISHYKIFLFSATVIQNSELVLELPKYSLMESREPPASEPPGACHNGRYRAPSLNCPGQRLLKKTSELFILFLLQNGLRLPEMN